MGFSSYSKKTLASTNHYYYVDSRWIVNFCSGFGCCAIYLYDILILMYILGISAFYHDSAACLIKDGKIISAAQEERFTRKKHDSNFPRHAIKFCLNYDRIKK